MEQPDWGFLTKDELNDLLHKIDSEFMAGDIVKKAELHFQYLIAEEYLHIIDLEEQIQDSRTQIEIFKNMLKKANESA